MLETERLHIIPLTYHQLITYLKGNNLFENEIGLADTGRNVSPEVKVMVEEFTLPKMKNTPDNNYIYVTFWVVIEKKTNSIVAELGFKGEPNDNGEVEIGYGTMPLCRCKGFMTEAVGGILQWASQQKDVKAVLAETNHLNNASIRVLQKNGFALFEKREEMLWWRKSVHSS
jgi:ribosomal-protein-alanine N-acetyltransferase